MTIRTTGFALILAGSFVFGNAQALDDAAISKWLGTMEDWQELSETQEPMDNQGDGVKSPQEIHDMDYQRMLTRSAQEHPEAEAIIRNHGYRDIDEWAEVGSRILRATMAMEAGEGMAPGGEHQREMEKALREIDENPHLSEAQKDQIRQQMGAHKEMLSGLFDDVPPGDLEAVKRNRDAIMRGMDENPR